MSNSLESFHPTVVYVSSDNCGTKRKQLLDEKKTYTGRKLFSKADISL